MSAHARSSSTDWLVACNTDVAASLAVRGVHHA